MSGWDIYSRRMQSVGATRRETRLSHTQDAIRRRVVDSLSYHEVLINGTAQGVSILNQEDLSVKKICALPGEPLKHGGLVDFANNKWLITELDANNEVYQTGMMQQCNHVLRWIGKDGMLKEKWCFVEDGTKYLIGERSEQLMTVGDARIAVTVGKDEDTIELSRGLRFLIDDSDSDAVLAYQITKPNKMFNVFNGEGVFRFILTEVNLTDADNTELRIADYTNWKPKQQLDSDHVDSEDTVVQIVDAAKAQSAITPPDDKGVWL